MLRAEAHCASSSGDQALERARIAPAGREIMKVTVDFDCTPEEARRFMGLPDLTPVHQAYIERMQKAVTEGVTPEYFTEMMETWGPMSEGAMNMWRTMFDQMSGKRK
jgi:hypothetical protein